MTNKESTKKDKVVDISRRVDRFLTLSFVEAGLFVAVLSLIPDRVVAGVIGTALVFFTFKMLWK